MVCRCLITHTIGIRDIYLLLGPLPLARYHDGVGIRVGVRIGVGLVCIQYLNRHLQCGKVVVEAGRFVDFAGDEVGCCTLAAYGRLCVDVLLDAILT